MCDRLAEHCARELQAKVASLVDHHRHGRIVITSPIFSGSLSVNDAPKLARLNRAGLFARAWFSRHGPAWAQPLPLNDLERIRCFVSDIPPLHLLGFYSYSLQGRDFDFRDHPLLYEYSRGVMACPHTQDYLRGDLESCSRSFHPRSSPDSTNAAAGAHWKTGPVGLWKGSTADLAGNCDVRDFCSRDISGAPHKDRSPSAWSTRAAGSPEKRPKRQAHRLIGINYLKAGRRHDAGDAAKKSTLHSAAPGLLMSAPAAVGAASRGLIDATPCRALHDHSHAYHRFGGVERGRALGKESCAGSRGAHPLPAGLPRRVARRCACRFRASHSDQAQDPTRL